MSHSFWVRLHAQYLKGTGKASADLGPTATWQEGNDDSSGILALVFLLGQNPRELASCWRMTASLLRSHSSRQERSDSASHSKKDPDCRCSAGPHSESPDPLNPLPDAHSGSAPDPLGPISAENLRPSDLTSSSLSTLYLLALTCLLQELYRIGQSRIT